MWNPLWGTHTHTTPHHTTHITHTHTHTDFGPIYLRLFQSHKRLWKQWHFDSTQQMQLVLVLSPFTPNCLHMTMILSLYLALWHKGLPTSSKRDKRGHAGNSCDNSLMSFNWLSAANNWVKLRRISRSAKDSRLLPDMFSTSRWPCVTDKHDMCALRIIATCISPPNERPHPRHYITMCTQFKWTNTCHVTQRTHIM